MPTYFQGSLKQGVTPSESTAAVTSVVTSVYDATIQAATVTNVDTTIVLPRNSQIIAIYVDTTVAWTASGAVTFTAGTTAGGTEYITSIDLKTVTRGNPTLTAAQLLAMNNIGTNTNLVLRANTASGANAVGTTLVTVLVAVTE